jgi:hypothetical protein
MSDHQNQNDDAWLTDSRDIRYYIQCKRFVVYDDDKVDAENLNRLVGVTEVHIKRFVDEMTREMKGRSVVARPGHAPKIVMAPGTWASRILGAVLTKRAFRVHVLVALSEMREEYNEEYAKGRRGKAEWVRVRGHLLMVWAWVHALCPSFLKKFLPGG